MNRSFKDTRKEIYKEIQTALQRIQVIDKRLDQSKLEYQSKMAVEYKSLYSDVMDQRNQAISKMKEYKSNQLNPIHFEWNEKVRLNVGGNIFETSHSTLCRDPNSLLATMFSGRHELLVEADESYFIDRDPLHFRLILNYLRDLRVPPVILQDINIREELLQEADYYCIQGLVNILSQES